MASLVRNCSHNDCLEQAKVAVSDVIFGDQPLLDRLNLVTLKIEDSSAQNVGLFFTDSASSYYLLQLGLTFERVEDGGANHQISECANDQGKGAHVLALHFQLPFFSSVGPGANLLWPAAIGCSRRRKNGVEEMCGVPGGIF